MKSISHDPRKKYAALKSSEKLRFFPQIIKISEETN